MNNLALKSPEHDDSTHLALIDRLGPLGIEDQLDILISQEFGGRIAVLSSFGTESAVLLDMVARIDPATPVMFIDTGMHFPQTLAYKDLLQARLGLTNIVHVGPTDAQLAAQDPQGTLHQRNHDACCALRKVTPLKLALQGFDALITGRKRYHGAQRSRLSSLELSDGRIKINPLAGWTAAQIENAFEQRGLPRHPLMFDDYLSLGCAPCTQKTNCSDNMRAGRWAGTSKTECGIHSLSN